jgi:hypothetical protein
VALGNLAYVRKSEERPRKERGKNEEKTRKKRAKTDPTSGGFRQRQRLHQLAHLALSGRRFAIGIKLLGCAAVNARWVSAEGNSLGLFRLRSSHCNRRVFRAGAAHRPTLHCDSLLHSLRTDDEQSAPSARQSTHPGKRYPGQRHLTHRKFQRLLATSCGAPTVVVRNAPLPDPPRFAAHMPPNKRRPSPRVRSLVAPAKCPNPL